MRMRRAPRAVVAGFLLSVAVTGLAGCRTSPNVAAYVGDAQITVGELETAVDERFEDEAVAAYAEGREEEFTRRLLGFLVEEEVHAAAAQRYDVEVGDQEVRDRIEELLEGQDAEAAYAQLAAQGIGRTDVFENIRQQLVRQRIAEAEGLAEGLSEEALRERYEEVRESLAQVELGYITVPDQATADRVLAQLTANPRVYPQLAARFAGGYTLPDLEARGPDRIPGPLADAVAAARPGTGFTLPVEVTGGVVVGFVGERVYPSFEEVRGDLENEAAGSVDQAARKLVDDVRKDVGVTVNPRFGVLEEGEIRPAEDGVVDILDGGPDGDAAGAGGTGG